MRLKHADGQAWVPRNSRGNIGPLVALGKSIKRDRVPIQLMIYALLTAFALATPSPSDVKINSIAYGGTGCPQGSVAAVFNQDRSQVTFLYDEFIASAGPKIPTPEARRFCQIAADIQVPQGWSFSLATVDYRGYADLPSGGVGSQTASYYFQSSTQETTFKSNIYGPTRKDYLFTDRVPVETVVWSECNASAALNLKTSVQVSVPHGSSGMLTTDSADVKVKQVYGVQWRRC